MAKVYHRPVACKRTVHNGIAYDSRMEANRASQLELLQRAGKIAWILRQVPIDIGEPGVDKPYRVDFVVCECTHRDGWEVHAEEITGFMTASKRRHIKQWRKRGPFPLHIITTRNVEIVYPEGWNQ